MKHILFVDDDPNLLSGIRRVIRKRAHDWTGHFAGSGLDALALMREHKIDVVVTDMRMPRMDGSALLRVVSERYPNTVRIVLSGHQELEAALRAVPIAHQFLVKPCEPERLCGTIDRACALKDLLADERLGSVVSGVSNLPSVPKLYQRLCRVLGSGDASLDEVGTLIEQDPSMALKVLQLVNSAFFGLPRRLANVRDATAMLGTAMLKNLVLGIEVFSAFPVTNGFCIEAYQRKALQVGTLAMRMFETKSEREDAFTAGMLHDVGRLIIATYLPEELAKVDALVSERQIAEHAAEQHVLGVSHAEVGAYLLGLWGLPYTMVEATACHHQASPPGSEDPWDIVRGVWLAAYLAHEGAPSEVPPGLAEHVNIAANYSRWFELARGLETAA